MSEIEFVHTPCKKCVFAKYDNITQVGCLLNYIEAYKKQNIEILEVFDDELEFFVINNKKCTGYRENTWFTKYGLENASIEEKIAKFKELNKLDYFIVVNLIDTEHTDLQLKQLSSEIAGLDIKPQKIIFVRYRTTALKYDYDYVIKFLKDAELNKCPWKIQTMEDDNALYEHTLHNIITLNKFPRFVLSIKIGEEFNINNMVNKANSIVYDNLDRFSVISNKNENCLLFSGLLYRFALISEHTNILQNTNDYIRL